MNNETWFGSRGWPTLTAFTSAFTVKSPLFEKVSFLRTDSFPLGVSADSFPAGAP